MVEITVWFLSANWTLTDIIFFLKNSSGASQVAQWLRIRLPMQGTGVWALAQEDPTCRGAAKPMCHNCWACTLEHVSDNYWARVPQLLKRMHLEPVLHKRSHDNEKLAHHNKEQPLFAATRESPRTATKIQHSQK